MDYLLYEPRSLWSIANVVAADHPQFVRLPRTHFYNGSRWPITLNRIALAGINYFFGSAISAQGSIADCTAAIINRTKIRISSPQQFYWNSRAMLLDAAHAPLPTAQPPQGLTPGDAGEVTNYLPSSLWGQCMLKFDNPLILPQRGSCEWWLSAHTPFPAMTDTGAVENAAVRAWMLYQEKGGMFAGSARFAEVPLLPFTGNDTQRDPQERWPYPPDDYGAGVPSGIASTSNWWPGESSFPSGGPRSFTKQESTRQGSTELTDMRVFIDQRLYDQRLYDNLNNRPSPLSLRTGTRIRTVNTGSNTWWWRPGAPLALVFDHITPALVMKLAEPITLAPQDQLDVEMEFPAAIPDQVDNSYHVGISFNGFATIEG